jgi:hypothetical protein
MNQRKPESAMAAAALPGQAVFRGSGWWATVLLVLILGLACGFAGARFWFQDQASQRYSQLKTRLDTAVAQNQADSGVLQAKLDMAQGQFAVEQSTRKGLEQTLQATQVQLGKARDQLAFFDQLLPPGPNGAISIRGFDIQRQGSALQYRALFMRNAPGDKLFNGAMQFVAQGKQNGKTVKITLGPVQVAADTANSPGSELALSFDQFQRSAGILSIPAGFIPETITLDVLEGKTVRASRTVKLPRPARGSPAR